MFTPKLGRVSVQNDCASPGAWAQLHPDNKLNMTVTATRHLIFTNVNTKVLPHNLGQFPVGKKAQFNCARCYLTAIKYQYLMDLPTDTGHKQEP